LDSRLLPLAALSFLALGAAAQDAKSAAQPAAERRFPKGGDLDKIVWEHPFARARELARAQHRVLLVKPILGGSNVPAPLGVACGGKNDCEGSW
jgi:hypothetical protein